jgi:hypothetical protein
MWLIPAPLVAACVLLVLASLSHAQPLPASDCVFHDSWSLTQSIMSADSSSDMYASSPLALACSSLARSLTDSRSCGISMNVTCPDSLNVTNYFVSYPVGITVDLRWASNSGVLKVTVWENSPAVTPITIRFKDSHG